MNIGIDGRCINPSTHIRGGGYVEVECYCEAHALEAAKRYGDTELPRVLDPNHGCLDTTVGLVRNRRRCQWEEGGEARRSAAELSAQLSARTAEVDAVRRESAALFEQEYALRQGLHAANAELRAENAELRAANARWASRFQDQLDESRAENERLRAENTTLREAAVELGLRAGGAGGGVASLAEEVARLRRLIAEVAEVSAQMEALEAKWNACTEDHKGRSTDRPCPACGFGG